jgi:proteasome lid subunit RPN8/RPN11
LRQARLFHPSAAVADMEQSEKPAADGLLKNPAVRRECAIIANSQGVDDNSISVEQSTDGKVRIVFGLSTEALAEKLQAPIQDSEPIVLVYTTADSIGIRAPEAVLSGRGDFPRQLGHLNAVPSESPASFCLARAGLQPLYDRFGVEAVLERLRSWMRDAQTGGLMADGWEPVPVSGNVGRLGTIDAAVFQDLALRKRLNTNWTTGCAHVFLPEHGDYVQIFTREFPADSPKHNSLLSQAVAKLKLEESRLQMGVPWVFIWTKDPTPEAVFSSWATYADLRQSLEHVGLGSTLDTAIGTILTNGCDCKHAPGRKSLIVLLGVWRPKPIVSNIFGLSEDPAARCLEMKAYSIEAESIADEIVADAARVREIVAWPVPSRKLFQWVSGLPTLSPVTIFGYGALGSTVADHLLRSGITKVDAIDPDRILPHNLGRHRAGFSEICLPKVHHLKRVVDTFAPQDDDKTTTQVFDEDITELSDDMLAARVANARLIIDATADERARIRLVQFGAKAGRQVIRLEIYDQGRLGLEAVTGPESNPDLFDLFYLFLRMAMNDEEIAKAIRRDQLQGATANELLFGFGCASATMRLPNFVVTQHAAAFMPTIVDGLSSQITSSIGVNILDQQFRPKGWRRVEVPQLEEFRPRDADGWVVRIHPEVIKFLNEQRQSALPSETGGYLYGGYDPALKRIVVVEASGLPPNSKGSGSSLELGPAGKTALERRLRVRTAGRVVLCGTWHTHPNASAAMSGKDRQTIGKHADFDYAHGIPTLLVIAADGDLQVHLQV